MTIVQHRRREFPESRAASLRFAALVCMLCSLAQPSTAAARDATPTCGGKGKPVCELREPASYLSDHGCPADTFFDPRNRGECWSCPSGYRRSAFQVTSPNACVKPLRTFRSATQKGKPRTCSASAFRDLATDACWTCEGGYERARFEKADSDEACALSDPDWVCDPGLVARGRMCVDPNPPPPSFPQYTLDGDYALFDVLGFDVRLQRDLVESDAARGAAARGHVEQDLIHILSSLTTDPVIIALLRDVPIWVLADDGRSGAEYHHGTYYLSQNNLPLEWADSVVINNVDHYAEWVDIQPAILLHELTHGLHAQLEHVSPEAFSAIQAAYDDAMQAALYDDVAYAGGGRRQAYATVDAFEYFAEISEALLWTNDFYPFTRAQLESHDPVGEDLAARIWFGDFLP